MSKVHHAELDREGDDGLLALEAELRGAPHSGGGVVVDGEWWRVDGWVGGAAL